MENNNLMQNSLDQMDQQQQQMATQQVIQQQQQYAQQQQQYAQQQYQQTAYQAPVQQQQPVDPNYAEVSKDFLTKAIVAGAISTLPVGSIIAINMATKNRAALLDYLSRGGLHTVKIKISSALSRAARYSGIGYTIFWAVWLLYYIIATSAVVIGILTQMNH
jgi:sRNA-binding protein